MSKKNGDLWFPHDYNALNNPQLIALISREGAEGYGIYWGIVETMHKSENGCFEKKEYNFDATAQRMRATAQRIKAVVKTCIDIELFEENEQYIMSLRVIENLEHTKKISETNAENARKLWLKRAKEMRPHNNRSATASEVHAYKTIQDKTIQEEKDTSAQTRVEISFEDFFQQNSRTIITEKNIRYPEWIDNNEDLKKLISEHIFVIRVKKKAVNTGTGIKELYNELEKLSNQNIDLSKAIVKKAIVSGWKSYFLPGESEIAGLKVFDIVQYAKDNLEKLRECGDKGPYSWKHYLVGILQKEYQCDITEYLDQNLETIKSITDIIEFATEIKSAIKS